MRILILLPLAVLASCAGPMVTTTTTARSAAGGETITTTKAPYEKPFDRALSQAMTDLMQTQF